MLRAKSALRMRTGKEKARQEQGKRRRKRPATVGGRYKGME